MTRAELFKAFEAFKEELIDCGLDVSSNLPNIIDSFVKNYPLGGNNSEEKFEEFWKLYPRKQGKKDAANAFKRISPEEIENIFEALKRQKNCRQWQNPQYIPLPASYLRGERWKDSDLPDQSTRPRYGNFDPQEALTAALDRSYKHLAN